MSGERLAKFRVSYALIENLLHMPVGDEIVEVSDDSSSHWGGRGWVEFIVTSPNFPEIDVEGGEMIPVITTITTRESVKFYWLYPV